jgi:hypothetical protein
MRVVAHGVNDDAEPTVLLVFEGDAELTRAELHPPFAFRILPSPLPPRGLGY